MNQKTHLALAVLDYNAKLFPGQGNEEKAEKITAGYELDDTEAECIANHAGQCGTCSASGGWTSCGNQ